MSDSAPRVLLLSGWQTVNIGDVAHTPGAIAAFRDVGAEVKLWPRRLDARERQMLQERFPQVEILPDVHSLGTELATEAITAACDWAQLGVHSSAPALIGASQLEVWRQLSDKPYGTFGITVDPLTPTPIALDRAAGIIAAIDGQLLEPPASSLLADAAFVMCRDTLSRDFLVNQGISATSVPDATVCLDIADESGATELMARYGLVAGEFLCLVPRLRYTPYYQIRGEVRTGRDVLRDAVNQAWLDHDLTLLRDAAQDWVRRSGKRVLVVPEMSYAVEFSARYLSEWPSDVSAQIDVVDHFWSLPVARSVYAQAAAVLSMECHSPLIALSAGTPAVYLRQSSDTIKGQMYPDLGLNSLEADNAQPDDVIAALSDAVSAGREPVDAAAKLAQARVRQAAEQVVLLAQA